MNLFKRDEKKNLTEEQKALENRRKQAKSLAKKVKYPKQSEGKKLFKFSIENKLPDLVQIVAKKVDIQQTDQDGNTACHWAAMLGHNSVIDYLLRNSANTDEQNALGQTPVHLAVIYGHTSVLRTLCTYRAQLNTRDRAGTTPIWYGIQTGQEEICKTLLESGADYTIRNNKAESVFFAAIGLGWTNFIELLCLRHIDLAETNAQGNTALHVAAQKNQRAVVETLLKFGAPSLKNRLGMEPHDVAQQAGLPELSQYISQNCRNNQMTYGISRQQTVGMLKNKAKKDEATRSGTVSLSTNNRSWSTRWIEIEDQLLIEYDKQGGKKFRSTNLRSAFIRELSVTSKFKWPNCISILTPTKFSLTLRLETLDMKEQWSRELNLASDPNWVKSDKPKDEKKETSEYSTEYEHIKQNATISGNNWQEISNKLNWLIEDRRLIEEQWIALEEQELTRDPALFSEALLPCNADKNRYLNVAPYNSTRVTLTSVEGGDYINASYVASGSKIYIAAQAPLESGIREWYLMLYENFVFTVLMLTKIQESGVIKASDYFPTFERGFNFQDIGLQVQLDSSYQLTTDITVRKILLQRGDEPPRTLTHYHFVGWPDHGIPEPTQLYEMKRLIDEDYRKNAWLFEFPQVVHCSAGIGRTGTWIVLATLVEDFEAALQNNEIAEFNLMSIVENIRNQRTGMLTSIDQFEFLYEALLHEIAKRYPPQKLAEPPAEFKTIRESQFGMGNQHGIQGTRNLTTAPVSQPAPVSPPQIASPPMMASPQQPHSPVQMHGSFAHPQGTLVQPQGTLVQPQGTLVPPQARGTLVPPQQQQYPSSGLTSPQYTTNRPQPPSITTKLGVHPSLKGTGESMLSRATQSSSSAGSSPTGSQVDTRSERSQQPAQYLLYANPSTASTSSRPTHPSERSTYATPVLHNTGNDETSSQGSHTSSASTGLQQHQQFTGGKSALQKALAPSNNSTPKASPSQPKASIRRSIASTADEGMGNYDRVTVFNPPKKN